MPHGILGLYPRASCHSPSGTGLQREAQSQAVSLLSHIGHQVLPLGCECLHAILDAWPQAAEVAVKPLYARYASLLDGLHVGGDALAGHVTADEVEPGLGPIQAWGLDEAGRVLGAKGCVDFLRRRSDVGDVA